MPLRNLGFSSLIILLSKSLHLPFSCGQVYGPVSRLDGNAVIHPSTNMGDATEEIAVQSNITSREHEEILDTIDKIRGQGISRYVDIPQIVVCGDQSSGKQSFLALNLH